MRLRPLLSVLIALCGAPAFAATLQQRLETCLACHGEKGQSETPEVPSLGAQPPLFLGIELFMFRAKQRRVEIMNDVASDLTDADLNALAEHLARQPPPQPPGAAPDAARFERGRELARTQRCGFCHNPDYSGREQMPRLAHQREDYLLKAMRDYKSGVRPGYEPSMAQVLYPVNDAQIADLAHYLAHFR
jgi:cytochrome c553